MNLVAKVSLDGSSMKASMAGLEKSVNKFGSNTLGALKGQIAAAFSVGALVAFGKSVVSHVTQIKDLSEQYDISTDSVQKYQFAARKLGLEFEDVGNAMMRLGAARRAAGEGDTGKEKALEKFGITMRDIQNSALTTEQLFAKMMAHVNNMGIAPSDRGLFSELMGKRAERLLGMAGELAKITGSEEWLISQANIQAIDDASKKMEVLWANVKGIAAQTIVETGNDLSFWQRLKEATKNSEEFGVFRIADAVARAANPDWKGPSSAGFEEQNKGGNLDDLENKKRILEGMTQRAYEGDGDFDADEVMVMEEKLAILDRIIEAKKTESDLYVNSREKIAAEKTEAEFYKARLALSNEMLANEFKRMTVAEQRVRLESDIADLTDDANSNTGAARDRALLEIEQKKQAIWEIDNQKNPNTKASQLQRGVGATSSGNFIGMGAGAFRDTIGSATIDHTKAMKMHAAALAEAARGRNDFPEFSFR